MVKIIIDGKQTPMGRLASHVAKQALLGNELAIVNCQEVIITGNKEMIEQDLADMRARIGSGQKGPKVSRSSDQIVKRAIRGMLPNHRRGRGKEALKRIRCFVGTPKEIGEAEKISLAGKPKSKSIMVGDLRKHK